MANEMAPIEGQINKPNQDICSETLQMLAAADQDLYIVTSDSRGSGKLVAFGQKFSEQIVEVGIAEQNLVGVAAGIASMGKKTFAVSPACFLSARALEQIKNDICYSDNAVTLIGISAGVSYGALGTTHHSLHDLAVLRAINNITIIVPADNYETHQAIKAAYQLNTPVYLRFGKKIMPANLADDVLIKDQSIVKELENDLPFTHHFEVGKARLIRSGDDLTFIATGETVWPALKAAKKLLLEHGIESTVLSMHTIKPLDTNAIAHIAKNGKPIITVEEHSVYGGLGEALASFLMQNSFHNKLKIVGLPDDHTVSGSQIEIFNHYGISGDGLCLKAKELLNLK